MNLYMSCWSGHRDIQNPYSWKCVLEIFGEKEAFFALGGTVSRSGMIDVLFEMRPKYLHIDEIEDLSLMETGIVIQTIDKK
jgi:hypothetical protein